MLMTTHEMGDTQADDDAASEDGTQDGNHDFMISEFPSLSNAILTNLSWIQVAVFVLEFERYIYLDLYNKHKSTFIWKISM